MKTRDRNRLARTFVLKALEEGPASTRELCDRFNQTYSWGTHPRMLCNVLAKNPAIECLGNVDRSEKGQRIRSTMWGLKEVVQ